jgi:hypothetical protein
MTVNQRELEEKIRENPVEAVVLALLIGFLVCLLPVGRLIGSLLRVAFLLLKPALLVLGIIKAVEYYQQCCREEKETKAPEEKASTT